jgi:hypothetical protein
VPARAAGLRPSPPATSVAAAQVKADAKAARGRRTPPLTADVSADVGVRTELSSLSLPFFNWQHFPPIFTFYITRLSRSFALLDICGSLRFGSVCSVRTVLSFIAEPLFCRLSDSPDHGARIAARVASYWMTPLRLSPVLLVLENVRAVTLGPLYWDSAGRMLKQFICITTTCACLSATRPSAPSRRCCTRGRVRCSCRRGAGPNDCSERAR